MKISQTFWSWTWNVMLLVKPCTWSYHIMSSHIFYNLIVSHCAYTARKQIPKQLFNSRMMGLCCPAFYYRPSMKLPRLQLVTLLIPQKKRNAIRLLLEVISKIFHHHHPESKLPHRAIILRPLIPDSALIMYLPLEVILAWLIIELPLLLRVLSKRPSSRFHTPRQFLVMVRALYTSSAVQRSSTGRSILSMLYTSSYMLSIFHT